MKSSMTFAELHEAMAHLLTGAKWNIKVDSWGDGRTTWAAYREAPPLIGQTFHIYAETPELLLERVGQALASTVPSEPMMAVEVVIAAPTEPAPATEMPCGDYPVTLDATGS